MKISKIEVKRFKGDVYNLELNSNIAEDDLYWIEGKSNIVTHNCFPKDLSAILTIAQKFGLGLPTITGAHITNMTVRKDKDWLKMEGRAISHRAPADTEEPTESLNIEK